MKKKLGDMTIREIREMCVNTACTDCENRHACEAVEGITYLGIDIGEDELNIEVEIGN